MPKKNGRPHIFWCFTWLDLVIVSVGEVGVEAAGGPEVGHVVSRGGPEALMEAVMEAAGGCLHHTGQAHRVLKVKIS
jgi:hypothetical protein